MLHKDESSYVQALSCHPYASEYRGLRWNLVDRLESMQTAYNEILSRGENLQGGQLN